MDRFENCSNCNRYFNFMISTYAPVKFSHSEVTGLNSGMAVQSRWGGSGGKKKLPTMNGGRKAMVGGGGGG
jgi:hypothetical protein